MSARSKALAFHPPSIKGGIWRRIQIHPRMMLHPFPGVKFRGNLARRLRRMSKDSKIRNLLEQGRDIIWRRFIQLQKKTDVRANATRSQQHSASARPHHEPGEQPPAPNAGYQVPTFPRILLLPTKDRGREVYRKRGGATLFQETPHRAVVPHDPGDKWPFPTNAVAARDHSSPSSDRQPGFHFRGSTQHFQDRHLPWRPR